MGYITTYMLGTFHNILDHSYNILLCITCNIYHQTPTKTTYGMRDVYQILSLQVFIIISLEVIQKSDSSWKPMIDPHAHPHTPVHAHTHVRTYSKN